jgi:ubiquinone biosynthesis protein
VAELHIESGWVPAGTRVQEMESAIRTICEPIFDRPLNEISFGTVLMRLFAALRRFDGEIQPQLILLQKTLFNVEGLGRQLYPELDIWKTATPVLRAWMRERMSPRTQFRELRRGLPDALEIFKSLPTLGKALVEKLQDGTLKVPVDPAPVEALRRQQELASERRDTLLLGGTLLLAGVLWRGLPTTPAWPSVVLVLAGLATSAWAWRPRGS